MRRIAVLLTVLVLVVGVAVGAETVVATHAVYGEFAGKVGGAFASVGGIGGGGETTLRALIDALLIHGMILEGCHQGGHFGPVAVNKPDERAAKECRLLGGRVANLAARLGDA